MYSVFKNRQEAGNFLAKELQKYKDLSDVIVVGLPRGGVVTAYEIATNLNLPLDITCPRKICAPYNPELVVGAITETGTCVFNDTLIERLDVSQEYLSRKINEEKREAEYRLKTYRKSLPPRDLKDKIVIVVDDGLATGATMEAAINSLIAEKAAQIIVAVPASSLDTFNTIKAQVDDIICLSTPEPFYAIERFYEDFSQASEAEVMDFLQKSVLNTTT
ncbi:MAG: putative phosphoribosyl transferase [Chlamydiales bacterium]|jgi:putative phosphoribosyl transferase